MAKDKEKSSDVWVQVQDAFSINGAEFTAGKCVTRDEYVLAAKMEGSFEGRIASGWLKLITPEEAAVIQSAQASA